jgi:hypothetical protein
MTLTRSFIRNAPTTPLDARLMNMAGLVQNADGSPRVGVLGSATLGVGLVTALATMNVAVAAAEFATSKSKADGVAIFTNDGTVNVAITAAPASNSRIDVIWVKHNDDTTGDANALPVFGVTAGVAAASPTKPAIPTGALELATLRVYAGTTAANGGANTLVETFAMTAARGGVVALRNATELAAWTNPGEGQNVHLLDTEVNYRRENGAWVCKSRALVSAVTAVAQSIANGATTDVLFPAGVNTVVSTVGSGISFNQATGVVTINEPGTYRITGQVVWAAGGSINSHVLMASKNNNTSGAGLAIASLSTTNTNEVMNVEAVFDCVANDTLRLKVLHVAGAAKNIGVSGSSYYQNIIVERIVA